jgi:hypothetical protein
MFTIYDVLRRLLGSEPMTTIEAGIAHKIISEHEARSPVPFSASAAAGSGPPSPAAPEASPGSATSGEQAPRPAQ